VVNLAGLLAVASTAEENLNMRSAYLEVMADALGSAGVVVVAVIILLTGWTRADALMALGIAYG
jgi:cobalt-zinc-cadmium efflux system protein